VIITIDGPAGSGKSTVARKLAARLEVAYLDTGAMYRALALAALKHGIALDDAPAIIDISRRADIDIDCAPTYPRVHLDGHDVSEEIRSMEVSRATSAIARVPEVRRLLVEMQRQLGEQLGSLVAEGRDQGTIVFPDADLKVILDATLEARTERRFTELFADGEDVTRDDVRRNLSDRDRVDAKQWAPLLTRSDVLIVDTTDMSIAEVVDRLAEHYLHKSAAGRRV
jgi:cytidylate kinase